MREELQAYIDSVNLSIGSHSGLGTVTIFDELTFHPEIGCWSYMCDQKCMTCIMIIDDNLALVFYDTYYEDVPARVHEGRVEPLFSHFKSCINHMLEPLR
jgi:hypothetical protein